jgi:uncharacterized protein (DUF58 family)
MRRHRLTLSGQRLLVAAVGLALLGTQFGRPGLLLLGVFAFAVTVMAVIWCPRPVEPVEGLIPPEIVATVAEPVSVPTPFTPGTTWADRFVQWSASDQLTPRQGQVALDAVDPHLRIVPEERGIAEVTMRGSASDQWGLFARSSRSEVAVRLVVHPARVPADVSSVMQLQAMKDHGDDLDGTRPWRAGDRSAAVDWRGFARGGGLRVRQRTETVERVVLHVVGDEPLTDATVGLALDAALRLSAAGIAVDLPLRALPPGQRVAPHLWAAVIGQGDVVHPDELPAICAQQDRVVVTVPTGPSGVAAAARASAAPVVPLQRLTVLA